MSADDRFDVHPEAAAELEEIVEFYEDAAPGLGEAAFQDYVRTLAAVLKHPGIGHPYFGVQRFLFSDFPFSLVYRVREGRVQILAVAHFRRRPGYWKQRTQ